MTHRRRCGGAARVLRATHETPLEEDHTWFRMFRFLYQFSDVVKALIESK